MQIQPFEKYPLIIAGLKTTKPRVALLHILQEEARPLSALELVSLLKAHTVPVDQATVYRILEVFADKGLIKRLNFHDGIARFEAAGSEHHHLVCERCGAIADISDCFLDEFQGVLAAQKSFVITGHDLVFYGLCGACQQL